MEIRGSKSSLARITARYVCLTHSFPPSPFPHYSRNARWADTNISVGEGGRGHTITVIMQNTLECEMPNAYNPLTKIQKTTELNNWRIVNIRKNLFTSSTRGEGGKYVENGQFF